MDLVPHQTDILEFIQAGVSGFILKDADINEFYKTIRAVDKGAQVLPPNLTGSLFTQIIKHAVTEFKPSIIEKFVQLTKREKQVIDLVADGLTNKEIAQRLKLSTYTAKSQVHNILEKLALQTRLQIVNFVHMTETSQSSTDTESSNSK
jgi:DNA-binding NarL/FixJ family response regulator